MNKQQKEKRMLVVMGLFAIGLVLMLMVLQALVKPAEAKPKRNLVHTRTGIASYHDFGKRGVAAVLGARRGSIVRVCYGRRCTTVTTMGSGPYVRGRVIDLSPDVFTYLFGGLGRGTGPVTYTVLRHGKGQWAGKVR